MQGRVVRPLLLHHVNTSAQALQLVGGMRERRNKQCAKIATSVLQLCSFCFLTKSSRALMLMLTLLHLSAVHSTPCACSNLQWLQAEHSLRCLGYTIELEVVLCRWCGGEEVGSHEIRHEVLLIFAVLANVPVVDCSNKRFAVENLRSPETSILAVLGAVLLRFLYFLHPPLHLLLAKCLFVLCSLELLKALEGSRDVLEHLFRVALGVDVLEVVIGFLDRHLLCHQLLKSWLIHTQKLQALAGCYDCRSHPRVSTKPLFTAWSAFGETTALAGNTTSTPTCTGEPVCSRTSSKTSMTIFSLVLLATHRR